jgi:hypothetical protein
VAEYVFAVNIRGVDRRAGVREDGRVPNRLASATSPYLLQHADNPVDWWEWGEDAFAEARRRDVPVLLSGLLSVWLTPVVSIRRLPERRCR